MNGEDEEVEVSPIMCGNEEKYENGPSLSLFKYVEKSVGRKEKKSPSKQTKRLTNRHSIEVQKDAKQTVQRSRLSKFAKKQKEPPRTKTLTGLAVAPFLGPLCNPSSLADNYKAIRLRTPVLSPQCANARIGRQRLNFMNQDAQALCCEANSTPKSKFRGGKGLWRAATTGCIIDLDVNHSDKKIIVIEDSPVLGILPNVHLTPSKHGNEEGNAIAPMQIVYDSEDTDVPISQSPKEFHMIPGLTVCESLTTWTNAELAIQVSAFGLKAVKSRAMMISLLSRCYSSTVSQPVVVPESLSLTARSLQRHLFHRVKKLIQESQSEWHKSILTYQPIVVEHLAEWLCTQDCHIDAKEVKAWCEAYSVCCVYEESLAENRSKKKASRREAVEA